MNFLPEQIKILESKDKNLIVSASAGSGKTTVMIEKLIKLITEENVNVKNLLVLTYTKSAAEEMKQKLINALYEKALNNFKYVSQIDDVMTADISTIHSFFQKLIKKHFMLLDVDPNFCVIEEKQSENLKYQALKKAISVYGEEKREKLNLLLDIYGKSRSEKTIYKLLDKINIFLSAVDNPEEWCEKTATKFCENNLNKNYAVYVVNKSFYETAVYYISVFNSLLKIAEKQDAVKYVEYINNIISQLSLIKLNKNEFLRKLQETEVTQAEAITAKSDVIRETVIWNNETFQDFVAVSEPEKLQNNINQKSEISGFSESQTNINTNLINSETKNDILSSHPDEYTGSFFDNYLVFANFDFKTLKQDSDFPDLYQKIVFHREKLKDFINKLKTCDYSKENVEFSIKNVKEIINILLELNSYFEKEYSILKKAINALDFNDLEKYAFKLSLNKDICARLSRKYAYTFIDEFQDANRLQEKILSALTGGNWFMVGDVKQSIYGFRQAEPDIFLEMQKNYTQSDNSEVMFLNSNFRSHKNILAFVNLVFNEIMTIETAKLDYKNTAQLESRLEFLEDEPSDLPRVELDIIKFPERTEKPSAPPVYSVREHSCDILQEGLAEKEAILTAEKISNLVGKKYFNISEKTFKELQFKDISILLNARGSYLDKFCSVLSGFNIPIYANTNASLLSDEEVNIFVCLLRLCKNFNDDISLAVCLNSVFGGLSYSQLGRIRLVNSGKLNKENKQCFYECVNAYNSQDEIYKKILKFKNLLNQVKFDIGYKGIYFALNKIINQFDYYSYLYSKNNGREKVSKIKKFLQDLNNCEFNFNLIYFLDYIDESPDSIKAPNYVSGDNCVNITTIHSSKGLEYPVVILANAGAEFTGQPRNSEIEINLSEGIALQNYNPKLRIKSEPVMFDAMLKINKSAEFAEKLRLLYVALTRAKNYLIITGSTKNEFFKLNSDFEIKQKTNFLELIVGALPKSEIDDINSNKNIKKSNYCVNIYDSEKISAGNLKNNKLLFGKFVPEYVTLFNNYFNLKLPEKDDTALKNSVTTLSTLNIEPEYTSLNISPIALKISEHLSEKPADIGIIYHKVFEMLEFNKVNSLEDIESFLTKYFPNKKNVLNSQKIFESVCCLKKFYFKSHLKEQRFMMYVPHNEIVENGSKEKILIQGIADLILLGEKNILIDYKYSLSLNEDVLKQRYKMQLKIYKKAIESALNKEIDGTYILLINSGKLLKMPKP